MTAAQLKRIHKGWTRRLKLEHWDIDLNLGDHDIGTAHAEVWKSWDYNQATVRVEAGWRSWSVLEANYYLAHELLHVAMRDVDYCANESRMDTEDSVLHGTYYDHARENFVDALAERLLELGGVV